MKKALAMLLGCILVMLGGCNIQPENSSGSSDGKTAESEYPPVSIYDHENNVIDTLDINAPFFLIDDGMIYTTQTTDGTGFAVNRVYYRYNFKTKESIKLGTIEHFSSQSTEEAFIGHHVYLYVATDMRGITDPEGNMKLYDIDLSNNTMTECFSENGSDVMIASTAVGDRVLVTSADASRLQEYNTKTKEIKTLITYNYDYQIDSGETIRNIASDDRTISLLILKVPTKDTEDTEDNVELRIDRYDHDMNFLGSVDLSHTGSREVETPGRDFAKDELRQSVRNFMVSGDYVYYRNYSMTRFLGKIEGNTANPVMEVKSDFWKATDIGNRMDTSLFFRSNGPSNELFLLDKRDGTIKKSTFFAEDKRYQFLLIFRDRNDNLLFLMQFTDPDTGAAFPTQLYYVSMSDLIFE